MVSTVSYTTNAAVMAESDKNQLTANETAALAIIIPACSRTIDQFCNRVMDGFVASDTATARVYSGSGSRVQWIHECVAITQVAVKVSITDSTYTAWTTADWLPATGDPEYPDFNSTPYNFLMIPDSSGYGWFTSGQGWSGVRRGFPPELDRPRRDRTPGNPTVQVTAKWGYSATLPDGIKQAATILATRWFKRGKSAWGDVLVNTENGQVMYAKPLDQDIKLILQMGRFVRPAIGGLPK